VYTALEHIHLSGTDEGMYVTDVKILRVKLKNVMTSPSGHAVAWMSDG
jgi:hypothetical protein